MNDSSTRPSAPPSVEEGVCSLLGNARQGICQRYEKCENRIRSSPTEAVLGAVAVGYLMHRLPIRAIVLTQIRLISALTPPALLLFGAAKFLDCLRRQEPE